MHAAMKMYRRVDLDSAPKPQILERMFDRFARDVAQARAAIGGHDLQGKANAIDHALRIVAELEASLDFAAAPELCANLVALYDYVGERLTTANTTLAVAALDQAASIMAELGAAFAEAHRSR